MKQSLTLPCLIVRKGVWRMGGGVKLYFFTNLNTSLYYVHFLYIKLKKTAPFMDLEIFYYPTPAIITLP